MNLTATGNHVTPLIFITNLLQIVGGTVLVEPSECGMTSISFVIDFISSFLRTQFGSVFQTIQVFSRTECQLQHHLFPSVFWLIWRISLHRDIFIVSIKERNKLGHKELFIVVYYESLKRELQTKPIQECRCDERLQTRFEESTRLIVYYESIKRELERKRSFPIVVCVYLVKKCHAKIMKNKKSW